MIFTSLVMDYALNAIPIHYTTKAMEWYILLRSLLLSSSSTSAATIYISIFDFNL